MSNISATFTPPPLNGTLSVDQIYDWHHIHSPDFPAFVFSRDEGVNQENLNINLTWKELGEGVSRAAEIVKGLIPETRRGGNESFEKQPPIVVGILATSDIITYTTFLFALIRLTHPTTSGRALLPFPLSTRNSTAAISHLIRVTGISYLCITDGPMRKIANEAVIEGGPVNTTILRIPTFSELYSTTASPATPCSPNDYAPESVSLDSPALILHSSGSTAFPKPRTLTHRVFVEMSRLIELGDLKLKGEVMAVHASPVFHAMGMHAAAWAAGSGLIRAVPSPHGTNSPATPEYLLEQLIKSGSTTLLCVPSFLETWSKEPKSIEVLRKLKAILWAGGPLNPDAGRFLRKEGFLIHNLLGATEFGVPSFVPAKPYPEGYEWFKFLPHVSLELIPQEGEEGIFELVIKECESHHLSAINTEIGGTPAYATNDLIERHPTNPELFKVKGRKDDQIMLSTGEKTNPGPLESIICENPHVKTAIMFGRGRFQNGILIEPESYEESEIQGVEKFRNLIWSSIEGANNYAPAHSRIFKEMVLIASRSKPFTYTAKQSARRGAIMAEYAPEIDAVYKAVQESSQIDIPIPAGSSEAGGWTVEESLDFVGKVVNKIMTGEDEVGDEDDLFSLGCDSLQATYIRNSLLHALRQVAPPANVQKVPSNIVYQKPTIRGLAGCVAGVTRTSGVAAELDAEASRINRLNDMVAKYTQNWPVHRPSQNKGISGETILLTGSTGGLGSQLLAQLVMMPYVSRVYAFNRPARGGKTVRERQADAFLDRGNDVTLLDSEKITFVEGDTALEGLGIDHKLFNEIRDSVTTIIHNAWRVDFNISLSSFEPAIRGVRYLVDLALQSPHASPPRVMFTSSIGNVKSWLDFPIEEGPVTDLSLVNPSGYSESKWMSERILASAGAATALKPVIIRVGQLCGGINGNWNTREWFPALARASQVVGGVPDNHGLVSFLPLHVAASALIELRHTSSQFVHLVHPRPVSWNTIIQHIADVLRVPLISYDEWISRLEATPKTDEALQRNPALHLIDFYRASAVPSDAKGIEEREVMGMATYETTRTVVDAPSLGPDRLPQLCKEDVSRWIKYWRGKGALDA